MVYGVNKELYSCDAFLGLPTDVMAMEYRVVCYYPAGYQCQLMVVGIHDTTNVSVTFGSAFSSSVSYGGSTYRSGDTLTTTIDR